MGVWQEDGGGAYMLMHVPVCMHAWVCACVQACMCMYGA